MGTGAPSSSNRRKNPSEERKRKKKAPRKAKSSKRRRHDSPLSSSRSDCSSPSASSLVSEGSSGGRGSGDRTGKKDALLRQQRAPSRDGGLLRRQKKTDRKKRKKSYQCEREPSRRRDSGSKPSKGKHQKKDEDRRRRRHSSSRSTSVASLDKYSSRSCSTCRSHSNSPERSRSERSLRSKGKALNVSSHARGRSARRGKERSERRRSRGRYRSPSCSTRSRFSHGSRSISRSRVRRSGSESYHDEERLMEKSRSGHPLMPTSSSVNHSNEMEGIIQDCDDLHYSRSKESYGVERKRDSAITLLPRSSHALERKRHDDSSVGTGRNEYADEECAHLNREISSVVVTGSMDGAQWDNQNYSPMPRERQTRLKSQVSTSGGGSEADELELLLRLKALENFKKFRAHISTNTNSIGEKKCESIPSAHEVTPGKSGAVQLHESATPTPIQASQKSYSSLEHHISANDGSQLLHFKSMSDANAPALACSLGEKDVNKRLVVQRHPSDTVNTKSVPRSSLEDPCSKEFQAESSGKVSGEDLSSKNLLGKEVSAKAGDTNMHKKEANKVDAAASTDASCHKSASEFEQKTMSVLHGGEVVQVSSSVSTQFSERSSGRGNGIGRRPRAVEGNEESRRFQQPVKEGGTHDLSWNLKFLCGVWPSLVYARCKGRRK